MAVQPLTLLAKIKPGHEEVLRAVLGEVAASPDGNPYIRLSASKHTHLANWVIIKDPDNGPRLFFSSNYDGDLPSYVNELLRVGPDLDGIFNHCEDYPGRDDLLQFVNKHSYKAQTYFAGFPEETVKSIQIKRAIRRQLQVLLDLPDFAAFIDRGGLQKIQDLLQELGLGDGNGHPSHGFLAAIRGWLHNSFFGLILRVAHFFGGLTVNKHYVSVASNLGQVVQENISDTDSVQDQMTNLIDIRRSRLWLLRVALALMNFLGRYAFPPGDLAGVKTIHFARWVIIDNGKRLLFQSKFDGSWENYMGDFVDKVAWGLDGVWSNTVGYPEAGMNDFDAFKRFIRDRQFEHLVVYAAFPYETNLNLGKDRQISVLLAESLGRPAFQRLWQLL
jgi:hypothetical protein